MYVDFMLGVLLYVYVLLLMVGVDVCEFGDMWVCWLMQVYVVEILVLFVEVICKCCVIVGYLWLYVFVMLWCMEKFNFVMIEVVQGDGIGIGGVSDYVVLLDVCQVVMFDVVCVIDCV